MIKKIKARCNHSISNNNKYGLLQAVNGDVIDLEDDIYQVLSKIMVFPADYKRTFNSAEDRKHKVPLVEIYKENKITKE